MVEEKLDVVMDTDGLPQGTPILCHSVDVTEIVPALIAAQKRIPTLPRSETATVPTKKGGTYSYDYTPLDAVLEVAKPPLNDNGVLMIQGVAHRDGVVWVESRLVHTSGQYYGCMMGMGPAQDSPQAIGSAESYVRRYSWYALLNMASGRDDDGAAASIPAPTREEEPKVDHATASKLFHARWQEVIERVREVVSPEVTDAVLHDMKRGFVADMTKGAASSTKDCSPAVLLTMVGVLSNPERVPKLVTWLTGDGPTKALVEYGYAVSEDTPQVEDAVVIAEAIATPAVKGECACKVCGTVLSDKEVLTCGILGLPPAYCEEHQAEAKRNQMQYGNPDGPTTDEAEGAVGTTTPT